MTLPAIAPSGLGPLHMISNCAIEPNTRTQAADEAAANADDPALNLVEQEVRRATLIADRQVTDGKVMCTFDIRIQGESETVFFDI